MKGSKVSATGKTGRVLVKQYLREGNLFTKRKPIKQDEKRQKQIEKDRYR
jgi:hypothetical protein